MARHLTHFCPEHGSRYQCLRVGCMGLDAIECDPCFDEIMPWPVYDAWAEHVIEEVKWLR